MLSALCVYHTQPQCARKTWGGGWRGVALAEAAEEGGMAEGEGDAEGKGSVPGESELFVERHSRAEEITSGWGSQDGEKGPGGRTGSYFLDKFPSLRYITGPVQRGLQAVHDGTGLPWWATIAVSTIGARICLLPLSFLQIQALGRLGRALPDMRKLTSLTMRRMTMKDMSGADRLGTMRLYIRGLNTCARMHNASFGRALAMPVANISLFITFLFSIRDMVVAGHPGMANGGLLWFKDLSVYDSYYYLPLISFLLGYLAIEIGFGGAVALPHAPLAVTLMARLKDVSQMVSILMLPIVSGFPAGIFTYWIPSHIFSMGYTLFLRSPRMREFIRTRVVGGTTPGLMHQAGRKQIAVARAPPS